MALTSKQWQNVNVSDDMSEDWAERRVPVGNFWGWMQLRKTILGEHDFAKLTSGQHETMAFNWDRRM